MILNGLHKSFQMLSKFISPEYRHYSVFTLGTLIHIPMLSFNLSEGDSFRFTQTTFVVREFVENGIDFRMPLPLFGSNSFIPLEFPIFQIVASFFSMILNIDPSTATRLSGLLFFQGTGLLVYLLAKKWFDNNIALYSIILFQFLPFGLKFAHSPLIEFMATFFILVSVFFFSNTSTDSKIVYKVILPLVATISLVLGFLVKVTTGVALLPLLAIPVISILRTKDYFTWKVLRLAPIFIAVFLSVISVYVWNSFADDVKQLNPFTSNLMSTNPQWSNWNFGTLQDRLEPKTWIIIYFQYFGPITTGLITLTILSFFSFKYFNLNKLIPLIAVVFFGPVIFVNLYRSHQYYVAAIYPILVILISLGIAAISKTFSSNQMKHSLVIVSLLIATSFTTKIGLNYVSEILNHSDIPKLAYEIREVVPRNGSVLYLGCDWNPEIPFYSDRNSLMVPEWGIMPLSADLKSVQYVAFCDYIPLDRSEQFNKYFPNNTDLTQVSENIYSVR
jgi:hypothetical protein